jgi:hypothetical protein
VTHQQKAAARSAEVRQRRAQVKQGLKRGEISLSEALDVPECQGMRAYDLLAYLPVLGPSVSQHPRPTARAAARSLLRGAGANMGTTVEGLGQRRRDLILKAWEDGWKE